MRNSQSVVGITMGDPAGIGPEIIVTAFERLAETCHPVVIGDRDVIEAAIDICDQSLTTVTIDNPRGESPAADVIPVIDIDNIQEIRRGLVREEYGHASLEYIEHAIELATGGQIDAMTTAPINKQATKLAGSSHAAHTGMLAAHTNTEEYAMMLIEENLRVSHVSTHVPLREACELITTEHVTETIELTHAALQRLGIEEPSIAVAGLNPHASDGGLLGTEEQQEINPAVAVAQQNGVAVSGPESPDTVYVRAARGEFDCVVSMYHDQGHIPIKMLGFAGGAAVSGVNVTIGLPIVRTSVDHGTAFDIAGEGVASEQSLIDAVEVAVQMTDTHD
jgi:4-hydroxythreonine-4-phosphate dehydrogenase